MLLRLLLFCRETPLKTGSEGKRYLRLDWQGSDWPWEAGMQVLKNDPYDAVAYPGFAYPDTHPGNLAAMAILHGLSPAPVERCRVLEVACGDGGNLIPMAYAIPGSTFVGFDVACLPIERGQERIRELGLSNIRLFQGNLLEVGAGLGMFDYIIAHGLYAWAPEPVRDRLLALCRELLLPHGVAFVSYNALPGGYLRRMIREMMLFRVGHIEDAEEKAATGIAFLHSVLEARAQEDALRLLTEEDLKRMERRSPQAIFHDELSEINEPVYFSEFAGHARRHGLQYLSESVLPFPADPCYRADLRPTLEGAAGDDIIGQEQVLDFMRMRRYRETLLCHVEREVRRDFPMERFRGLLFASQTSSSAGDAPGAKVFTLPGGARMETTHAATIALMEQLEAAWPRALSAEDLEANPPGAGFSLEDLGAPLLMRLVVARMIELRGWRAPAATEISTYPRASASARQEARGRSHATTFLHMTMKFEDPLVGSFLVLLDGTRDRAAIFEALKAEYPALPPEQIEEGIERNLELLLEAGMLEA